MSRLVRPVEARGPAERAAPWRKSDDHGSQKPRRGRHRTRAVATRPRLSDSTRRHQQRVATIAEPPATRGSEGDDDRGQAESCGAAPTPARLQSEEHAPSQGKQDQASIAPNCGKLGPPAFTRTTPANLHHQYRLRQRPRNQEHQHNQECADHDGGRRQPAPDGRVPRLIHQTATAGSQSPK